MTYAVFRPTASMKATELCNQIEVLFFIRKEKLKAFDASITNINHRFLDKNTANELVAFLFWKTMGLQSVSVVQFPKDLDTDKHLRSFGDAYIGCLVEKPKKSRLIEFIDFLDQPDRFNSFEQRLIPNIGNLKSLSANLNISETDLKRLEDTYSKFRAPVVKWFAAEREKLMREQQSFSLIKRDF